MHEHIYTQLHLLLQKISLTHIHVSKYTSHKHPSLHEWFCSQLSTAILLRSWIAIWTVSHWIKFWKISMICSESDDNLLRSVLAVSLKSHYPLTKPYLSIDKLMNSPPTHQNNKPAYKDHRSHHFLWCHPVINHHNYH